MVDTNEDQFNAMLDGVITKLGMLGVEDLSDSRENGDVHQAVKMRRQDR
jgi:hypothetical protein